MPSLWIGNFSFEDQLAGRQNRSNVVRRFEAELAPCFVAAALPDDYVLSPEKVDEEYLGRLEKIGIHSPVFITFEQLLELQNEIKHVCPWGWTNQVKQLAKELGVQIESPAHEAVLKTNSRSFSLLLAKKLNCELTSEMEVHSVLELSEALKQPGFLNGFVLKSEFGQSGRGQIISREKELSEKENGWANKRFKAGQTLYLEPKLKPVAEFGIQWNVPLQGAPSLIGTTLLNSGANGQFAGSTVNFLFNSFPELNKIVKNQKGACDEIQNAGYFGPVGIDAMIYESPNGERKIRPLQDINARWTMGRLAICWANICFPERQNVIWSHSNTRPSPGAIRTSPKMIGGKPVKHQTWCDV